MIIISANKIFECNLVKGFLIITLNLTRNQIVLINQIKFLLIIFLMFANFKLKNGFKVKPTARHAITTGPSQSLTSNESQQPNESGEEEKEEVSPISSGASQD